MTTYILCGGYDRKYDHFGRDLWDLVSGRVDKIKLCDVYFASEEDEIESRYIEYTEWFNKYFPGIERKLATIDNFEELMQESNVIFFHGGRTTNLLKALPDFDRVKSLLQEKIYIGSSAGANYLAKHFLSHDGFDTGSSILPINVVVHYDAEDASERRSPQSAGELEAAFPEVPTLRIREGEFKVIEDE